MQTGLAFHGLLAAMLVLFTVYWLRLNLLQTLPLVVVGGALLAVAGYLHLNRVADARIKAEGHSKAD